MYSEVPCRGKSMFTMLLELGIYRTEYGEVVVEEETDEDNYILDIHA